MKYAIVGFGKIGQALAHAFARKKIDVNVASRRPPEALAPRPGEASPVPAVLPDTHEVPTGPRIVPIQTVAGQEGE